MKCPHCEQEASRVIYLGAPMWFCLDPECSCIWGFWSWLPIWFPINQGGWSFFVYKGHYLRGLWAWFTFDNKEDT